MYNRKNMKTPISARIDKEDLEYLKEIHCNINGLINDLLHKWAEENKRKQTLIFQ